MMNLVEVKREIEELAKSPVAQKMFPITSDWVPVTDVLAIISRFEKHWRQFKDKKKYNEEMKLIDEILGEA
jgi:hypothetical protein